MRTIVTFHVNPVNKMISQRVSPVSKHRTFSFTMKPGMSALIIALSPFIKQTDNARSVTRVVLIVQTVANNASLASQEATSSETLA